MNATTEWIILKPDGLGFALCDTRKEALKMFEGYNPPRKIKIEPLTKSVSRQRKREAVRDGDREAVKCPTTILRATPFKNVWPEGCSDEQRLILEAYAQRLCDLGQTYHMKLLATGMDAMESALRIEGVNESDP